MVFMIILHLNINPTAAIITSGRPTHPLCLDFASHRINLHKINKMERYNHFDPFQSSSPSIKQHKTLASPNTRPKYKKFAINPNDKNYNRSDLHTIDVSNPSDYRIKFQPEEVSYQKGTPGVGEYDISSPLVRPAYETYEKSDQVILVKINHIGGTSSFRSERQRFQDGQNQSPGPGAYHFPSNRARQDYSSTYHQNYDLIQELLRNSRERTESMPNYKIGVSREGMQYNGMPKHLQEMYMHLQKQKEKNEVVKSLPLEKLIKLRKKTEKLPIMEKIKIQRDFDYPRERKTTLNRMTETLYKLDEQSKREENRLQKIRAILKSSQKKKGHSIDQNSLQTFRPAIKQDTANKNMVNILLQRTYK